MNFIKERSTYKMLSTAVLDQELEKIYQWFTEVYEGEDGFPAYALDVDTLKPRFDLHAAADFGDYAPFFLSIGKKEYADKQFELVKEYFEKEMLIRSPLGYVLRKIPLIRKMIGEKITIFSPVLLFSYTDFIFGLILCAEISGEKKYIDLAEKVFDLIFETFEINGTLVYQYNPTLNFRSGICDSNSGFFIEILVDLYVLTGKTIYLSKAKEYADYFLSCDFYRKYGLFPLFIPADFLSKMNPIYFNGRRKVVLAKNNVGIITGLLHLYRYTKDEKYKTATMRWIHSYLENFQTSTGEVFVAAKFPGPVKQSINLTNYALIDVLCDAFELFSEKRLLEKAMEIALAWIKRQSEKTGLMPWDCSNPYSWFDSETDMAIALLKVHEISGVEHYQDSALKIIEGQIRYHSCKIGYYTWVNINNGSVHGERTISTRYCSLFMKPLIFLKQKERIYQNPKLWSLLRDR